MRLLTVLLILFIFLPYMSAEEKAEREESKARLHTPQALEQITKEEGIREEFIEVSADSYPGLQLSVSPPLEEATRYRPLKYKHRFAHPDLGFLNELRLQDVFGTTAPQPSGKLIEVDIPTD